MPIYEYECASCGKVHEILQKFSEKPLANCPECSGALHKRISHCSFHLKGTGWYVTDYANSSKTNSSSPTNSNTDSSSSSTPETPAKTGQKESD